MDVHVILCSTRSPDATSAALFAAGFNVHVVHDTLHRAVLRRSTHTVRLLVCVMSPFTVEFLKTLNYVTYEVAILYDGESSVAVARASAWQGALALRECPPRVVGISPRRVLSLPHHQTVSGWISRVVAGSL